MTKAVTNVPTTHFNSLVKAIRYPQKTIYNYEAFNSDKVICTKVCKNPEL